MDITNIMLYEGIKNGDKVIFINNFNDLIIYYYDKNALIDKKKSIEKDKDVDEDTKSLYKLFQKTMESEYEIKNKWIYVTEKKLISINNNILVFSILGSDMNIHKIIGSYNEKEFDNIIKLEHIKYLIKIIKLKNIINLNISWCNKNDIILIFNEIKKYNYFNKFILQNIDNSTHYDCLKITNKNKISNDICDLNDKFFTTVQPKYRINFIKV